MLGWWKRCAEANAELEPRAKLNKNKAKAKSKAKAGEVEEVDGVVEPKAGKAKAKPSAKSLQKRTEKLFANVTVVSTSSEDACKKWLAGEFTASCLKDN